VAPQMLALRIWHRVIGALHATEFLAVQLMVRRFIRKDSGTSKASSTSPRLIESLKPGLTRATVGRMRNPKPVA